MSVLKSDSEFRNLLFDLDGTLTDSRPGIIRSIQDAVGALAFARPAAENLMWCVGPPLPAIFAQVLARDENDPLVARAVELYQEMYEATGVLQNSLYDGVPQMLSTLAQTVTYVSFW